MDLERQVSEHGHGAGSFARGETLAHMFQPEHGRRGGSRGGHRHAFRVRQGSDGRQQKGRFAAISLNFRFGFKLSLRGYAPELDIVSLVSDLSGRRVNPAVPEESLILLKALA